MKTNLQFIAAINTYAKFVGELRGWEYSPRQDRYVNMNIANVYYAIDGKYYTVGKYGTYLAYHADIVSARPLKSKGGQHNRREARLRRLHTLYPDAALREFVMRG